MISERKKAREMWLIPPRRPMRETIRLKNMAMQYSAAVTIRIPSTTSIVRARCPKLSLPRKLNMPPSASNG